MSFSIFGIEIIPQEKIYGIWVLSVTFWETGKIDEWKRPMLGFHYDDGMFIIHVFFKQFEIFIDRKIK